MQSFKTRLSNTDLCLVYGLSLAFLVLSILPWIAAEISVMAVGPGETHRVRETGMVSNPDNLTWTEWSDKVDHVYIGHLAPSINKEAKAVSYRIGTSYDFFTKLTFYQAKYRLPDEHILIAPINGPDPLVSIDSNRTSLVSSAFFVSFLTCIIFTIIKVMP